MRQAIRSFHICTFAFTTLASISALATVDYNPPVRKHGSKVVTVKAPSGNSSDVDTNNIQNAINGLPSDGGTVVIPAGTYMINALKNIVLNKSNVLVKMSSKTVLKVIPNSSQRYYVFNIRGDVHDVEIDGNGGQILGDRDTHLGKNGGEWGFGITVRGAERVTIRDLKISKMWGDGITITSEGKITSNDLVISNVIADQNRRQGLSVGKSTNVYVYNSQFTNTKGTLPEYGIDIEPDSGGAKYTYIVGCKISGNHGGGLQIYRNSSNTVVTDNLINLNRGPGILAMYAGGGKIARNQIEQNGLHGLEIHANSANFVVNNNYFDNNSTHYTPLNDKDNPYVSFAGYSTKYLVSQHMEITSSLLNLNTVKTNYYQH
jgi:parallel beta-helix repeat protein